MITNEITFLDFGDYSRSRIPENHVSLIFRGNHKSYTIYFPYKQTKEIREKGCTHFRVATNNLTGDIFFVFSKEESNAKKIVFAKSKNNENILIASKTILDFIIQRFNIKKDENGNAREYIKISNNLSNTNEMVTYKLFN